MTIDKFFLRRETLINVSDVFKFFQKIKNSKKKSRLRLNFSANIWMWLSVHLLYLIIYSLPHKKKSTTQGRNALFSSSSSLDSLSRQLWLEIKTFHIRSTFNRLFMKQSHNGRKRKAKKRERDWRHRRHRCWWNVRAIRGTLDERRNEP